MPVGVRNPIRKTGWIEIGIGVWGTRYLGLGRVERSTRPPQGNPEVRKRREPGLGGSKDGGGDLEEIPSLLEAPPEGEEREREAVSREASLLLPGLQLPQCPTGASYEPVGQGCPQGYI